MKSYFGRGPTKAKSYLVDDLLFVVMRGGMTDAEQTLLDAGEADAVRAFRQHFENVMGDRLIGTIEQLTGREVITYQSQVLFNPYTIIEISSSSGHSSARLSRPPHGCCLPTTTVL